MGRAWRGFNGTTQFFSKLTGSLCICDELEQQLQKGSPQVKTLFFFHTKKTNFLSSVYTVICFKKNRQGICVRSHLVFSSLKIFVITRFCCYFQSAFKHFVFTVFNGLQSQKNIQSIFYIWTQCSALTGLPIQLLGFEEKRTLSICII